MLKIQGQLQVFQIVKGEKRSYLTLQDFETGGQFSVGVDHSVANGLKPGQMLELDCPVAIRESRIKLADGTSRNSAYVSLPEGFGASSKAKAG